MVEYNWLVELLEWLASKDKPFDPSKWKGIDFNESLFTLSQQLTKMYNEPQERRSYRISQLGKPWLIQVLDDWFPTNKIENSLAQVRFSDGLWFEAWFSTILKHCATLDGMTVETQVTVNLPQYYDNFKVTGTIDFILNDKLIIETKSLVTSLVNMVRHKDTGIVLNDTYGYATQLSLYSLSAKKPACFVIKDKTTSELKIGVLDQSMANELVEKVFWGLEQIDRIPRGDLEALLDVFEFPHPQAEKSGHKKTGKYFIPPHLRDCIWVPHFYKVVDVAEKVYVVKKTKQESLQSLIAIRDVFKREGFKYEL